MRSKYIKKSFNPVGLMNICFDGQEDRVGHTVTIQKMVHMGYAEVALHFDIHREYRLNMMPIY